MSADVTTGADATAPAPDRTEPRANIALALAIVACVTGTIVPAIVALPLAGVAGGEFANRGDDLFTITAPS